MLLLFRFLLSKTIFVCLVFSSTTTTTTLTTLTAPAAFEKDVKPCRDPVHLASARGRHNQPERQHDARQFRGRRVSKVDDARLGAAHEARRVDGVDDDLSKITIGSKFLQARQVDPVKVLLPPEGRLGGHLGVEQRVGEGRDVDPAEGLKTMRCDEKS